VFDFVPDCVFDIIPESLLAFVGIPTRPERKETVDAFVRTFAQCAPDS
jgi:hypothetical protein